MRKLRIKVEKFNFAELSFGLKNIFLSWHSWFDSHSFLLSIHFQNCSDLNHTTTSQKEIPCHTSITDRANRVSFFTAKKVISTSFLDPNSRWRGEILTMQGCRAWLVIMVLISRRDYNCRVERNDRYEYRGSGSLRHTPVIIFHPNSIISIFVSFIPPDEIFIVYRRMWYNK